MKSIRSHLHFWQINALILAVAVASAITYITVWHSLNLILDHELRQIAVSIVRHGSVQKGLSSDIPVEVEEGDVLSQVWRSPSQLQYSSLPEEKLPITPNGYSDLDWNSHHWRIYTTQYNGYTIQAAHRLREREAIFDRTLLWALILPGIALVVILGLLLWFVVGRALEPLDTLRDAIAARSPQDLTTLPTEQVPTELFSLVEALNHLFQRVTDLLFMQRRFIADAAHELRTPLTAIKLQAQLASKAQDMEQCHHSLQDLGAGINRASHLIDQLLQMAKLEPDAQLATPQPLQLDHMVKQSIIDLSLIAAEKQIDLGIKHSSPTRIMGYPQAIQALIGNLVDNAIRYTPANGVIDVSVYIQDDHAILQVGDSGPGIPPEERERVFERFHRLSGSEVPGSGLGLAIVAEVVEMHDARISLDSSELGGLLVTVQFTLLPEQDK